MNAGPRPVKAAGASGTGPSPAPTLPEGYDDVSEPEMTDRAAIRSRFAPAMLLPALLATLHAAMVGTSTSAQEPSEKTSEAPRSVERRPEGGLSYRLLLGPAGRATPPLRLAVWLHPSGGRSFNQAAERLAPVFLRRGFAMLLPMDKDFHGWTYEDAEKLLAVTLPDAGKIEGVSLDRPLLLGFSSGGQVALELWMTRPDLYGGLILDAAHPAEEREGRGVVFAPPSGEAARNVPILAFVGEKDPLLYVWRSAEGPWREAGVPLTVRVVAGKGHEWLFGEAEMKELDLWLEEKIAPARPQVVAPPHEEPDPAVHP